MASARDGTPVTPVNKPTDEKAVISEFDPTGSTAKKLEGLNQTPNRMIDLTPGVTLKNNFVEVQEPQITVNQVASPKCRIPQSLTGKRSTGNLHQPLAA